MSPSSFTSVLVV